MIAVSAFHSHTILKRNAERRAEERCLNIVRGQGIPGQQGMHIAITNQCTERLARPGVNNRRPAHKHDAASHLAQLAHPPGYLQDEQLLWLL